jgi:AraC family transcriptional regulator, transcriptional activator FtrA
MSKGFSHRVAAIVADGSNPFEVSVATEFFGIPRPEIGEWYRYTLCAPGGRATMRGGLFTMTGIADLDVVVTADTVIVPNRPDVREPVNAAVLQAISEAFGRGARMVSFCTGAFTLAAAGVLDHRRACTHWMWADEFRNRFPNVDPMCSSSRRGWQRLYSSGQRGGSRPVLAPGQPGPRSRRRQPGQQTARLRREP